MYYAYGFDNAIIVALNSLTSHMNKGTEHTTNHITHFLYYCVMYPYEAIKYQRKKNILYISLGSLYILEPKLNPLVGGYLLLVP